MTSLWSPPLALLGLMVMVLCGCHQATASSGSSGCGDNSGCCSYYPHDPDKYENCCESQGKCNVTCDNWMKGKKGCHHEGRWYAIGQVVESSKEKCVNLRCCLHGSPGCPFPFTELKHVGRKCKCCEHDGILYKRGDTIHRGNCRVEKCVKGQWKETSDAASGRCPTDSTHFRDKYCVVALPVWEKWAEATELCEKYMGGWIVLPGDEPSLTDEEKKTFKEKFATCSGAWHLAEKQYVNGVCRGVPPGAVRKISLSCEQRLWPVCLLPLVPCDQTKCKANGKTFNHGETIKDWDSSCTTIRCENGYATMRIDDSCCRAEAEDGINIIKDGDTFDMPGAKKCKCKNGKVKCCKT